MSFGQASDSHNMCGGYFCVCVSVCVSFCDSFKDDKYQEMKDGFESYIYDIYYMVRKGIQMQAATAATELHLQQAYTMGMKSQKIKRRKMTRRKKKRRKKMKKARFMVTPNSLSLSLSLFLSFSLG